MALVSQNVLEDLGMVLCIAALTTVIFHLLRQPVVVGYLVAGMIVGPNVPLLFANVDRVHQLSALGVTLLMFALGLEFSIHKLLRLGPSAGLITALGVGLMLWIGYLCGRMLGWTKIECIFTGAMLSISSTTIVAKAYQDTPVAEHARDLVFGVTLAEDLVGVMLLAVLTAIASGAGVSAAMVEITVVRLAGFLVMLVGLGLLVVPRLMRGIVKLKRDETILIASIGLCFGFAIIADHAGYSVALGAFLAGSLVAESGEAHGIEKLIAPVRDLFGAVFFVSVGMLIDPRIIEHHWEALAVLTGTVLVGKFLGVTLASLLSGAGVRTAVQAGMSLAQIGEFSFIIAGIGLDLHATRPFLYSLAVAVSAITTFTCPYLIQVAPPVAGFVARLMPQRLGTFQSIYDAWMERMRYATRANRAGLFAATLATVAGAAAIDLVLATNELDPLDLTTKVSNLLKTSYFRAGLVVDLGALAVCVLPGALLWYASRALAARLAARALPHRPADESSSSTKLADALAAMLHATILVAVGMPALAIVQPFVEPLEGGGAVVISVILLSITIWRSGRKMQGQMPAIARVIADAISGRRSATAAGLGLLTAVTLPSESAAVGKSLGELGVAAATGASVVAIARESAALAMPQATEVLRAGDVLQLAGASEAVAAA
ncbi:MAG TPA: cation:proton antiporter, partial [Candidatus Binataceae bacterium]|nr:cation:proton antiporter [Candidatus Binataceae bacterium]